MNNLSKKSEHSNSKNSNHENILKNLKKVNSKDSQLKKEKSQDRSAESHKRHIKIPSAGKIKKKQERVSEMSTPGLRHDKSLSSHQFDELSKSPYDVAIVDDKTNKQIVSDDIDNLVDDEKME